MQLYQEVYVPQPSQPHFSNSVKLCQILIHMITSITLAARENEDCPEKLTEFQEVWKFKRSMGTRRKAQQCKSSHVVSSLTLFSWTQLHKICEYPKWKEKKIPQTLKQGDRSNRQIENKKKTQLSKENPYLIPCWEITASCSNINETI